MGISARARGRINEASFLVGFGPTEQSKPWSGGMRQQPFAQLSFVIRNACGKKKTDEQVSPVSRTRTEGSEEINSKVERKKKKRRAQVRIAGGSPGPDVVLLVPLWEERPPFLRSSQLPVITLSRNDLVTVSVFGIRFCSLHVPLRQLPKRPPELSRRDSRSGDSHVDRWPGMVNPLISFQQVETMLPE